MSLAFPLRNREIIKDSIKVRTLINEYIPLLTCRFVLIEIDGNQSVYTTIFLARYLFEFGPGA